MAKLRTIGQDHPAGIWVARKNNDKFGKTMKNQAAQYLIYHGPQISLHYWKYLVRGYT